MTTDVEKLREALTELLDDYLAANGPDGYPQPMPSSWRVVSDWLAAAPVADETAIDADRLAHVLHPWIGTNDLETARIYTRRIVAEYAARPEEPPKGDHHAD